MKLHAVPSSIRAFALGATLILVGCAPVHAPAGASPLPALPDGIEASAPDTRTGHVIVISIDGLRPDAIERYRARTIQRLMREGSYSLNARTIMPSRTLPSHTSMLTGEEPEEHGITWNRNVAHEHGHSAVPTVFVQAREHGFRTAAFFSKGKFHHLNDAEALDYARLPGGNRLWPAEQTVANVERHLARHRPNLMFVHFGEPDYAGHLFGWMTWFYGRAVRHADRAVAQVITAADRAFGEGNYTIILTADHGGHGRSHGSSDPRDVTIPWIAWGREVRSGTVLADGIRTMDTAATALWVLGIPAAMEGEPVRSAFSPGFASAVDGAKGSVEAAAP